MGVEAVGRERGRGARERETRDAVESERRTAAVRVEERERLADLLLLLLAQLEPLAGLAASSSAAAGSLRGSEGAGGAVEALVAVWAVRRGAQVEHLAHH